MCFAEAACMAPTLIHIVDGYACRPRQFLRQSSVSIHALYALLHESKQSNRMPLSQNNTLEVLVTGAVKTYAKTRAVFAAERVSCLVIEIHCG